MTIRIAPTLAGMATYPFVRLEETRRRLLDEGVEVIDFGKGDPNEPTDPRDPAGARRRAPERAPYPLAQGLPELRAAAAGWCARRFGVALDPETEIVPTYGSKEAISRSRRCSSTRARPSASSCTESLPIRCTSAARRLRERKCTRCRSCAARVPAELHAIPARVLDKTAIFWVNYPNNPTGAVAPLSFYERLAELAERYDFAIGSDEAYSELWFDEPPPSACRCATGRA